MKRLREIEAPSPLVQKAQALIDSVDPVPESHERMLRVRRRLDQPRGVLATAMRLPALALATLAVLFFGASAFAAVRIYVAVTQPAVVQPAPVAPTATQRDAHKHRPAAHKPAAADPAAAVQDTLPVAEPPALAPPAAPRTEPRVHPRSQIKTSIHTADSELVHRAVQALRVDHDPALATRLLDENRARNPHGPLAEEALSLQIEAAIDLGVPRARKLAAEYVARYPNGRYLDVAHRALAGAAP